MNTILAAKPYSDHPGDHYLSIVLAQNFKGEYVTWLHNSQDGGFYSGHYFGNDIVSATKDFEKRPN